MAETETDLLLINPSDKSLYTNLDKERAIEPPLWTAMIAGYIRDQNKNYSIKIIDANAENLSAIETVNRILDLDPILTGIVVMGSNPSVSSTPKMGIVRELLNELNGRKKTFLCGLHPSALPEQTLIEEKTDFIVQGEGFVSILNLLYRLINNGNRDNIKGTWHKYLQRKYVDRNMNRKCEYDYSFIGAEQLIGSNELPSPAWDLLPMEKYRAHNWHCFGLQRQNYGIIYTSLGCPYNCTYCNIHSMYGKKTGIRFRSPEKVIQDIDILVNKYNIRNIKIWDELFTINEKRVIDICDKLIEKDYDPKLNIWAYARVDLVNKKMLHKMKKAGINWIALGIESASNIVREGMSKKFTNEKTIEAVNLIKETGMNIIGNFIFGLPNDYEKTMNETLELAKQLQCEYANFYISVAYPGSQLYKDEIKSGHKLPEKWDDYSQYSKNIVPSFNRYLTGKDIIEFRDKAFQEYFTNPDYLKMIKEKFGTDTVKQIEEMTKIKVR